MKPVKAIAFGGIIGAIFAGLTALIAYADIPALEIVILVAVPFFAAMYAYKCNMRENLIYFVATMIVCAVIDWQVALFAILPSIVTGLLFGFLVKKKQTASTLVYAVALAKFVLSVIAIAILNKVDFSVVKHFLSILGADGETIGLGLLLFYDFIQAFLIWFILKYQFKKMKIDIAKEKYPPFWILILAVACIVMMFIPFEKEMYSCLAIVGTVVFASRIALYGYQKCEKIWLILVTQAVVFLAASLPLLKFVYTEKSVTQLIAYVLMFLPPLGYGLYVLLKEDYVKE